MTVNIEPSWAKVLEHEFDQEYFSNLTSFVKKEYENFAVFPPGRYIFRAFDLCPFEQIRVVIIGQDPYHTPGKANGLAFAVNETESMPPSLKNIFKEITADLGHTPSSDKTLTSWANQGVLLLNATLTVRASEAGSHQGKGWENFTNNVIKLISDQKEHVVFLLWGNFAIQKRDLIDLNKHLVLTAAHPSPFSADRGFFGCKHFSKTNRYLMEHQQKQVNW